MLNKLKFYIALILPVLSVLFIATPAYAAGHTYTIYAYGSGYIMVGILKSIASVVASGGFSLILKSVVLIGFVIIFLQMIITSFKVSPHRSLVKYFAAVLVIYSALLIPKVNVYVYDTVNNTTSNATVVNNVPWGIGAIASYFSDFQYYMTTSIEQAFSTPNTIDLTNAGMGFALTSQNIVDGVQIDDPYLFQSFTQYVYNCVLPGISTGNLSSQALTQAGMSVTGTGDTTNSLLGYMSSYTDGAGANLLTTEYSRSDPSGVTTTCGTQTGDIQTSFTNYATNDAGPQIAGALGMTYATFANEYGLVNSSIYSMSSNAEQEIIQMMAVNQYSQAMIQSANLAGVNPTQLAYGSALAQQNMSDSFSISGQMAGKYMPVVYSIFSALFLAFSLFLIILMALPIGVNYLKMYMELGLFLAVWPALMAVYNYIIDLIIQQQFSYLAGQGYSLNSAHTVNTFIATQLGWMGYLSWGVPMMAYALVTGSTYAMVGAISSMDAAGKSASSAAASQAASGNVNLGNDSMSNYSAANKSIDNLNVMDISTGNIRRNNVGEGSRSFASNTATGNNLINGISGGALNDKNFKGSITNTGGEVAMSGPVSRQGLESMIKNGDLKGNALTNAEEQLKQNPDANVFSMDASGTAAGGFSSIKISRAQQASNVNTGDINHSSKETLTGKPNQSFGGMDVSGLSGNISKIGNQVSATSLTGSKASLENFVKTNDPKSLGKAEKFLNKNPNSVLSFTSGGNGKMNSLGLKSSFNADHVNLTKDTTGSQKAKYNSSLVDDTHLTKLGSLTTNNNGYQGWSGSKIIHDNINNRNNERFTNNKFGSQSWRGNSHTIDNSITRKAGTFYQSPDYGSNQAFLNEGSYIGNYAKYTPGGAGIISGMKAKQTGAFATFNQNTQGMLEQYGGNINTLTFSADAKDTIKAQGGLNLLGNKLENEVTASVGVNGQSQIRANALRTDVGNQLTKYGDEYKNGKISWSKYQNNANGLVSTYKTLINVGSAPSGATAVNLGRNAIASASNGTIEQSELEANNPNELPGNLT